MLVRSIRHARVYNDEIGFSLNEQGEEATLGLSFSNPHDLDPEWFIVSMVIIWIRWTRWMIDGPILLERINFTFPAPPYADEFQDMFACRSYFNQPENSFVFSRRFLEPPEVVADHLYMTIQTLRRRLKEEGNAYQEIKDTMRNDTATYHLARLNTPINDIATIMGFSEPSAFNRAFKKWTGLTPGAYRESCLSHHQQALTPGRLYFSSKLTFSPTGLKTLVIVLLFFWPKLYSTLAQAAYSNPEHQKEISS